MKDNKYITRFMASVTLMAIAYGGFISLKQAAQAGETVRPLLHLTTGEVVDPATAPEVTKFNNSTAAEFAQMVFGDAEEAPDINEFLSRFTCSTCGKKYLLASPRSRWAVPARKRQPLFIRKCSLRWSYSRWANSSIPFCNTIFKLNALSSI